MSAVFVNKKTVTVLQGEFQLTDDPNVILSTVLGSCIAACIYDEKKGVGGMNHFLLAQSNGGPASARYGVHAMELLINGVMKKGADRRNLQAKVFGGAKMSVNLSDIGAKNASFIQSFLQDEGIPCVSSSVGGTSARRVRFHPVTGAAQQTRVQNDQTLDKVERAVARPAPTPAAKPAAASGDVMLF